MNKAFELACEAKPTLRQINWQETEFYGLISYGMPVFTGKQYGDGYSPASMFWPEDMDTDSWCEAAISAGMKGLLLTCKHYDGFCLWQTEATDYSVRSSNWLDGNGDLVRMLSESCKKAGLKFGIYLAPWDRHEKTYGEGTAYDDFFCKLLTELLTSYGDIFMVWLDAVCGAEEKRVQKHDWGRYYKLIRELQNDAVIAFRGPDVRWIGNERGVTRNQEWSSVPSHLGVNEDGSEISGGKNSANVMSLDIGSRKAIKNEENFIWYPCELSLPMRSHWFYEEDDKYSIKTKDKLIKLYYNSVGNNSCFMLGLSPDKRGKLDETDTQILFSLGYDLKTYFGYNLLEHSASVTSSSVLSDLYAAENCTAKAAGKFWRPSDDDKKPYLIVELGEDDLFDKIVISENIRNGQHIEEFTIEILNEKGKWKKVYTGETVGYKKICPLKPTQTKKIKITFTEYRKFVEISLLSVN